jgi:hypothetical protein
VLIGVRGRGDDVDVLGTDDLPARDAAGIAGEVVPAGVAQDPIDEPGVPRLDDDRFAGLEQVELEEG